MLELRKISESELQIMHDAYFASGEPDAPEKRFHDFSLLEQKDILRDYQSKLYFSVFQKTDLVGFAGVFPDGELVDVNIFYVILPKFRGQGFFAEILEALISTAKVKFPNYHYLRALTRDKNLASVRGLERAGFRCDGSLLETEDQDLNYKEYLLELSPPKSHL